MTTIQEGECVRVVRADGTWWRYRVRLAAVNGRLVVLTAAPPRPARRPSWLLRLIGWRYAT